MGALSRLMITDRPEESGSAEWTAARNNATKRTEYLVLIGALSRVTGVLAIWPATGAGRKGRW